MKLLVLADHSHITRWRLTLVVAANLMPHLPVQSGGSFDRTGEEYHGLEIRRGKSLGLFTRSSLFGALMRAGFCIAAIPIAASAQAPEQIAAMQAQITARQAQKNDDLAISQRDALQAQLEDAMLAANRRDSPQNPPKTGEAGANPSQRDVVSAADQSQPQQETQSATSEALPAPVRAKPQAENEQATASQNRAHRSSRTFRRPYTRGETSFLEPADLA
jgi:hypothetical protein